MWFIFGFITFVGFSIFFGRQRYLASWKGKLAKTGDIAFDYKISKHKGKVTGVKIGLRGSVDLYFSLKPESRVDRFFKAIGLAKEYQTRNKAFDDMIYIVSDDPHLQRLILGNKQVVDAVLNLCAHLEHAGYKFKLIRNTQDRLWIEFKPDAEFDDSNIANIAEQTIPQLHLIKSKLKGTQVGQSGSWKDSFALRAGIILAISSGLAINGAVHLFRTAWGHVPFTVDVKAIWIDAVLYSSVLMVAFVFVVFFILGRSARTHIVLIEVLLVGSFGAASNCFVNLRDANIEFDTSQPAFYQTTIHKRRMSRSRRSTSYYLYVDDWNSPGAREKIEVSSYFYRSVNVGQSLQVTQKNGNLGYKWVEAIEPLR